MTFEAAVSRVACCVVMALALIRVDDAGAQSPGANSPRPNIESNIERPLRCRAYPRSARIPLDGHARRLHLLVAGSTNHMQSQFDLKTGQVRIGFEDEFKGRSGVVPGGAATVLALPLQHDKELRAITVTALANEVVVGLMAATLVR